jgi:hypothetical protein
MNIIVELTVLAGKALRACAVLVCTSGGAADACVWRILEGRWELGRVDRRRCLPVCVCVRVRVCVRACNNV